MSSDNSVTNELEIFMHLNEEKPIVQVETSNDEIKAFGTSFHMAKARGFEVIVDAEGRINYTKLLERITGDRKTLESLCRKNSGVLKVIRSYDEDKLLAWSEKISLNLMPTFAGIKPEGKNSFLSSLDQKGSSHENDEVDRNDKESLNLMGFPPSSQKEKIHPQRPLLFLNLSKLEFSSNTVGNLIMSLVVMVQGIS